MMDRLKSQWYSILDQMLGNIEQVPPVPDGAAHTGCLVWSDPDVILITGAEQATPQQATWYLLTQDWVPELFTTCGTEGCLNTAHLSTEPAGLSAPEEGEVDDPETVLVHNHSTSLAALYRAARSRGLVRPGHAYSN